MVTCPIPSHFRMKFRAEEYFQASGERLRQARKLYDTNGDYSLSIYCGGLAVECMFRAFRAEVDPSFESRHDLSHLLKESRLLDVDDEHMRRRRLPEVRIREARATFNAACSEVFTLWNNNHRFASEGALRNFLRRIGRLDNVKGDPLKKNTLDLLNASQTVIDRGVLLWTSRKK